MGERIVCPHCGADMLPIALPKQNASGMWVGLTKCQNAKCKAAGPIICACNQESALEEASAAALRRYVPRLEPLTLGEAVDADYCYIELKNAESGGISKFSMMGCVSYDEDQTKACIWKIGAAMPTYAARHTYGATWRCWERKPTPEESLAIEWRAQNG